MGNILTVISRDKSSSSKQLKERQQDLDDLHWSANGELVGFFLDIIFISFGRSFRMGFVPGFRASNDRLYFKTMTQ